ncbi:unnamed protein product [Parajaminaea phylloscopi]
MAAITARDGGQVNPVRSILDSDLYKYTMQQAILESTIENPPVSYRFTNRSKQMKFSQECVKEIQNGIDGLAHLALTPDEKSWLSTNCPYLKPAYLDFLEKFRFHPADQVSLSFHPDTGSDRGDIELTVKGIWSEVILYEVPLMSIVSETYFRVVDTQWTMQGQRTLAKRKARKLVGAGIRFSEFGSRRRRSYESHKYCIQGLLAGQEEALASSDCPASLGKLLGTSNVHFAQMFDLVPIGTVAHEWTMAVAALQGYDHANLRALRYWDQVYAPPGFTPNSPAHDLTIALTDTFSTGVFFDDLLSSEEGKEIARRWRGLRQDSGDSKLFARKAKEVYEGLGIDPKTKVVIYSDSLNVDRCVDLAEYSREIGIGAGFGVGTFLTNDFRQVSPGSGSQGADADPDGEPPSSTDPVSKPLNIVIKIADVKGQPAVKISDELTKNTGDPHEVQMVKRRFGLLKEELETMLEDA